MNAKCSKYLTNSCWYLNIFLLIILSTHKIFSLCEDSDFFSNDGTKFKLTESDRRVINTLLKSSDKEKAKEAIEEYVRTCCDLAMQFNMTDDNDITFSAEDESENSYLVAMKHRHVNLSTNILKVLRRFKKRSERPGSSTYIMKEVARGRATERIPLTSIERSIEMSLKELDEKIVSFLNEPPPDKDKNVQAVANMNVLLFRYVMDYFNYLDGIGDLLLSEDNSQHAYRLLEEIGLGGPKLLEVDMDRKSWNAIAKMYGYHEGEIDEMVTTFGAIKVMWGNLKKSLETYLGSKKAKIK